jgi:HAD superfamily hydrolase (TIGR01484 family)
VLAFDLDDTLAVTKSPISGSMAELLGQVLQLFEICVISGGAFHQFEVQVVDRLHVDKARLARLHLMPTSGTRYYRFDEARAAWVEQYSEDLGEVEKARIRSALEGAAKQLGLWEQNPCGEIIEDRGSQITFSALGQEAPAALKYEWDRDGAKKESLRRVAAELLPDLEVRAGGTTSIDVTRRGIDKAYGMRKLMSVLGLELHEIVYFGDQLDQGGNDYAVKAMGIDTIAVRDSLDTEVALAAIIAVST